MDLDTFIADIKRSTQYGAVGVTNDKQTGDIFTSVVNNLDLISKYWPWDWLMEPVAIVLLAGVTDYTLPAAVENLLELSDANTDPVYYKKIGRDAVTGAKKIRLNTKSLVGPLAGFGKKRMTRFVLADIGTAKSFLPFPDDNAFVLKAFVMADVLEYQGKAAESGGKRAYAMSLLKAMAGQESTDPAQLASSAPPAYYVAKKAARRGGRVV